MRCGCRTPDSTTRGQALTPASAGAGSTWRLGGNSPTRPSSSMPMRGASWVGESRLHCTRTLALNALEQALHERRAPRVGLIHHSDRGVQYFSLRYTERLAQMGIAPSVGSVGDSYDNAPRSSRGQALAETIMGCTRLNSSPSAARGAPARQSNSPPFRWAHWYNHRRLFGPLEHVPPAAFEAHDYHPLQESAMAA